MPSWTSDEPGPLQFVNLLAFRDQAVYPEGHELVGSGLTGAEAYGRYGVVALGHVTRRGRHHGPLHRGAARPRRP